MNLDQKIFIEKNKDRFLEELMELLRIPSVSADPQYSQSVFQAAHFVEEALIKAGVDKTELYSTPGFPIVYGEKIIDPKLPTILVYGHYDVQPPDPLDLWNTPPFEPTILDGKIYARGACDDKGQMYMHIKAFETMVQTHSLACNVKFLIEGEEEIGSSNLDGFVKNHQDLLKSNIILISDTSMIANDIPSINIGLRGLSYLEVELTGPNRDLHSGVFGGAVANPAEVLSRLIASLKNEEGHITIPHFYDQVLELSSQERESLAKAPFHLEEFKKDLGIEECFGEKGFSIPEQTSIRPTLEVNGIWGGYIGEGAKTVLPSKAHAKISMRLVPNQDSKTITELFTKHFLSIAPKSVQVRITPHHGGEPCLTPMDSIAYQAADLAMTESFGIKPIPQRSGGSIPIVALFSKVLGIQSVLLGFGLDSDNLHSPNEHYGLFNFYKGIETIPGFHAHYLNLSHEAK